LATYAGNAPLQAWLKVVALNMLLREMRKRRPEDVDIEGQDLPSEPTHYIEEPILEIMRGALEAAFRECAPEEFLLLHLAHAHGLRGRELAPMFACSESKISRTLEAARHQIAESTLRHIKESDEWLEIGWEDIVDLCRVMGPSSFGVVE
jgi:RNA polymerase sigma factor (sigma-70 family)